MHVGIEDLVTQFEAGHLSRRQLVAHIAAWAALLASAGAGGQRLASRGSQP